MTYDKDASSPDRQRIFIHVIIIIDWISPMKRSVQISVFVVAFAMSEYNAFAQGRGETLQDHVNKDGRFSALMPRNTKSVTIEGKQLTDTYYESRGTAAGVDFKVRVLVITPIDMGEELSKQLTDMYVGQARQQQEDAMGTATTDEAIRQHGMQGQDFQYDVPAERTADGRDGAFRQRVLFDGTRLYMASLSGPANVVTSEGATQFLDSLQPLQSR